MRNFTLALAFATPTTLAILGVGYLANEVIDKPALIVPVFTLCATIVMSQVSILALLKWLRENDYI